MLQDIVLRVNGRPHTLSLDPATPLLYVLRNDLGLKAAKFGCGEGQCGACVVLIDGQPRPSCKLPVGEAQGREIVTLEGLAGADGALDPVQQAFIDEGAVQCGYCTPGMIVAARALLNRAPHPTDDEIGAALAAHLCRCGVYDRVRRAIHRAAGDPLPPARDVRAYEPCAAEPPGLPSPLAQAPGVDDWLCLNPDETVTVFSGKVELGQDLRTSVAMLAAEELDVRLGRVRVVMGDTARTPDEGYTGSSMSLETSGNAIRYACAEARYQLLAEAAEELDAPAERLVVAAGTILDPATGRSPTYWRLHGGRPFGGAISGLALPKRAADYALVGQDQDRIDALAKVTGQPVFVQDMTLPGMVYGRIVRPPAYGARLVEVDEAAARALPGVVAVVRDGSFLGVIAKREEQAVAAARALAGAAVWRDDTHLPEQATLSDHMLHQPRQSYLLVDGVPTAVPIPPVAPPAGAAQTLSAEYFRPYHAHASLGPSAAAALLEDGRLTVWTNTQGVFPMRAAIAHVLGMPDEAVRLIHTEGPGSFGQNGSDDAALDAALLARAAPGRPVLAQWSRADENAWEPYGPATLIRMQASLDAAGRVVDWNHDVYGYTHVLRSNPRADTMVLVAAWHLERPFSPTPARPLLGAQTGMHRNADPLYIFPRKRIVKHFLPDSPLRVSAQRGLGSYASVFAVESFMDELAQAAGAAPVAYRLSYLTDERARAVIAAAAERANWQPRARPSGDGHGRGFAFAQYKNRQVYVAAVVDVTVDRASGRIKLERATLAAEAGQLVNADGMSSQIEGGFIQSASWTLREEVTFSREAITSTDWGRYPILRLRDAPVIETVLLNRPGLPILGVGEGVMGPAPAAIANAVFDAVGVRLRRIPFTPERVRAAMAGA